MDAEAIRGVVLTLETLVSEPMEEGMCIVEGKPIKYWLGFISGYMLSAIDMDDPALLTEILESTPVLKREFANLRKIKVHTHEKETGKEVSEDR